MFFLYGAPTRLGEKNKPPLSLSLRHTVILRQTERCTAGDSGKQEVQSVRGIKTERERERAMFKAADGNMKVLIMTYGLDFVCVRVFVQFFFIQ